MDMSSRGKADRKSYTHRQEQHWRQVSTRMGSRSGVGEGEKERLKGELRKRKANNESFISKQQQHQQYFLNEDIFQIVTSC